MRIAIPVAAGRLAAHFGHCEEFALYDVDEGSKTVSGTAPVPAPDHQPGLLPSWLAERGVHVVIAGGMGARAQQAFAAQGIRVVVGAPSDAPEAVVSAFLGGALQTGPNRCDH